MGKTCFLAAALLGTAILMGCAGGTGIANSSSNSGSGGSGSGSSGGGGTHPGTLSASPASLDLGSVAVGATKTASVSLVNGTTNNVSVAKVSVSGTGFALSSVPAVPFTVDAGKSLSVSVSFTPPASGGATGTITVTSNATNASMTVALSGNGLAPGELGLSPQSLDFGNVTAGSSYTLNASLSAGTTSVTVSSGEVTGSGFSISGITFPVSVAAGQSVAYTVTFAPTSVGSAAGNISFVSDAANSPTTQALTGAGTAVVPPAGTLGANPASLALGSVAVGSNKTGSITLGNGAGGSSVTVSQVATSGAGFTLSPVPTVPFVIAAGQSTTLGVAFAPSAAGSASGAITVSSNASNPSLAIALTGTGLAVGQLGVSPQSLNFSNVTVGNSSSLSSSINAGGASITVSSASWNGQGFAVSGITFPVTVAAGQSVPYTVTFTPQTTGTVTGGISFVSNASNSPTAQSFSGVGVTAPTVNLSWTASTSTVTGYNLYRGTTHNGPYPDKLTPTPQPGTIFTDTTVQSGITYYYVATAVDNSQESGSSTETAAVIP